jgi:DNA-binding GntR family transcriptional regulator
VKELAPSPHDRPPLRYEHARDVVMELIEAQELVPGDPLPSARELADLAGVSMISIRRALDELERAGQIRRHQGLGTFVARGRIVSEPGQIGEFLATLGEPPPDLTTELLAINVGTPSPAMARALAVDAGQPVWEIERRRLLEGAPVVHERAVLPLSVVPSLDEGWLRAGGSLYRFLAERHGLVAGDEEQILEVAAPTVPEREALELSGRQRIVRIRGLTVTSSGVAFDCFQQAYPAKEFVFRLSGGPQRRVLVPVREQEWVVEPLMAQGDQHGS